MGGHRRALAGPGLCPEDGVGLLPRDGQISSSGQDTWTPAWAHPPRSLPRHRGSEDQGLGLPGCGLHADIPRWPLQSLRGPSVAHLPSSEPPAQPEGGRLGAKSRNQVGPQGRGEVAPPCPTPCGAHPCRAVLAPSPGPQAGGGRAGDTQAHCQLWGGSGQSGRDHR